MKHQSKKTQTIWLFNITFEEEKPFKNTNVYIFADLPHASSKQFSTINVVIGKQTVKVLAF